MKFTFEVEENDTISFLDIKITSENNSFLLQFIASLHLVTFLLILKVSSLLSFSLSVYLLCAYKTFFIFITIDYRRYLLVLAFDFFYLNLTILFCFLSCYHQSLQCPLCLNTDLLREFFIFWWIMGLGLLKLGITDISN